MHGLNSKDGSREIDWGKTSNDYADFRPGPPPALYERLAAHRVGLNGQSILDLGTGTGVLARQFARQGASVCGTDVSTNQIETAKRLAEAEGLDIDFRVCPSERIPWQTPMFDVVTANQCWLYFDVSQTIGELRRVMKPEATLVTSHFSWLPKEDDLVRQTEALVLEFNPDWSAAGWDGQIPACPDWSVPFFDVREMFFFDVAVPFTHESWRGRMRACRGVGATLTQEEIGKFDAALARLLEKTVSPEFTVRHRIDAHLFVFKK